MKSFINFITYLLFSLTILQYQAAADETEEPFIYAFDLWEPVVWVDGKGRALGMFPEILQEIIVNELGLDLAFNRRPWKRAQAEVERGASDILITIPTEARGDYAAISDSPVFDLYLSLYSYRGHPRLMEINRVQTLQDIADMNLTSVTNIGNGWHKENVEKIGVKTFILSKDQSIAKFLAHKRSDIMIDTEISMNHIIRNLDLERSIVRTDVKFGPSPFHIMLSKKSKHIGKFDRINKAIDSIIQDGRLAAIHSRYLGTAED